MNSEEKKRAVFEWIEKKKKLGTTVMSIASLSKVPVHTLYKAIEYNTPIKDEYIDKIYNTIETVFNEQI